MNTKLHVALNDRLRLEELAQLHLLDTPPEEQFDRLTRVAAQSLGAPIALVSLVDDHRQFFKSACGLIEPLASVRETPLSHSFCKYVVATSAPLIVRNAYDHPVVCGNRAVTELGVVAYLGIPLALPNGMSLGSFCVIDTEPRHWTRDDRQTMTALAAAVITEIALRSAQNQLRQLQRSLANQHIKMHALRQLVRLSTQLQLSDEHHPNQQWPNHQWHDATQTSLDELNQAVHQVLSTDHSASSSTDNLSFDQLREKLTGRQAEVFDLLMRGHQTKEIARNLGISPRTIEVHRSKILERLQINNFSTLLKQLLAHPNSH
jgi:DNA-binding CsgD family transcriptional regulator